MTEMETKSTVQQQLFRQSCIFCGGDHWNDRCPNYDTIKERKQILEKLGCCFNCLKRGHRAFECFNKKTCFFCKRETHHHRSLCEQNENFPVNTSFIYSINNKELTSRQNSKGSTKHNTTGNEQISATTNTQNIRTQIEAEDKFNQILKEFQQTKLDLEESRKEKTSLNKRISKLEAEQRMLHTSISQNTDVTQQLQTEINQLKENKNETFEHQPRNSSLFINSENSLAATECKKQSLVHAGKQTIGVQCKIENEDSQNQWRGLQHSNEVEECSFLETERTYRRGKTFSTKRLSAGGGSGEDTVGSQVQKLQTFVTDPRTQPNFKTTSFDIHSKDEEIMHAWVKVLGFLISK